MKSEVAEIVEQVERAEGPRFGPACRSVWWPPGYSFSFTADQAAVVALLRVAWLNKTADWPEWSLLERIGVRTPLRCLFRVRQTVGGVRRMRPHPAFGLMIVRGRTRGTYRLAGNPPAELLRFRELLAPILARCRQASAADAAEILRLLADFFG